VTCFKSCCFFLLILFFSSACTSESEIQSSKADQIVDKAIDFHGGDLYNAVDLSFGFREKDYTVRRKNGEFVYSSAYRDTLGEHVRRLDNMGYTEELNGAFINLSPKDSTGRAASVNSVVYFTLLPGLLRNNAVRKEYLGTEDLDGHSYHKIKVTFSEEDGGEDFDDVFLYWFSEEDYSMDYLAYSFLEDEGGSRFRKAFNRRRVNGLVFQDYVNFKGPSPDSLEFISNLYREEKMDTLSLIKVEKLRVESLSEK